ncbi:MAG: hypothetical protein M1816_004416 [Peltula sp. TS41687]|nr:MAG: hypothetical protein M1816_004416 [Peltula sp. TS41687]
MQAQEDPTPWSIDERDLDPMDPTQRDIHLKQPTLHGRAYFSQLGIVRRKPCRPDAPATLSKSCSDKLALKQCLSLLSSLTSLLVCPENVYLDTLILPASQYCAKACVRSFSPEGRLRPVADRAWKGGYSFRPFVCKTISLVPDFSAADARQRVPFNVSAVYNPRFQETLVNGVLQGRTQSDERGASLVSRKRMWEDVRDVLGLIGGVEQLETVIVEARSYVKLKEMELLRYRAVVKAEVTSEALKGWIRNDVDDFSYSK